MIDINKKYKTRSGKEIKIYEIYEDEIHGAYLDNGKWDHQSWELDGSYFYCDKESCLDLIEVKPYEDFKIDDKVLVWDDEQDDEPYQQHFAGINNNGFPQTWEAGRTSFSTKDEIKNSWDNCIKYEEENDKT